MVVLVLLRLKQFFNTGEFIMSNEWKIGDRIGISLEVVDLNGKLGNINCKWPDGYVRPIAPIVLDYCVSKNPPKALNGCTSNTLAWTKETIDLFREEIKSLVIRYTEPPETHSLTDLQSELDEMCARWKSKMGSLPVSGVDGNYGVIKRLGLIFCEGKIGTDFEIDEDYEVVDTGADDYPRYIGIRKLQAIS